MYPENFWNDHFFYTVYIVLGKKKKSRKHLHQRFRKQKKQMANWFGYRHMSIKKCFLQIGAVETEMKMYSSAKTHPSKFLLKNMNR